MSMTWQFWAFGAAIFAALTAIFGKVGVADINPDFATLVRTAVILLFTMGLVGVTGQFQPITEIPSKGLFFLTLSGLATGASWLCYFRALDLGEASRVAPVDKLSVVLVAIFGVLFLGERLSLKAWIGIGMIFSGVLMVMSKD
ncbi:MAG: EamA family transporter [Pseudomonadota bacterium]